MSTQPDMPQVLLEHHLKALRLPTILREYDKVARQCAEEKADFPRYLLRLSELELLDRDRRATERRIRQARFPVVKSLDSFDFMAIPSLNKTLVLELARCEYLTRKENLLLLGNSGTGKYFVDMSLLLHDSLVEAVKIGKLRRVGLQSGHIQSNLLDRFIQVLLPPTCDERVRSFFDKQLRRRQRHTGGCPGDHRHFTVQLLHENSPFARFKTNWLLTRSSTERSPGILIAYAANRRSPTTWACKELKARLKIVHDFWERPDAACLTQPCRRMRLARGCD
jgi:hypothetical protein